MSNPVAYISDNNGSKCKIMYRFKISAKAGIQFRNTEFPRIKYGAGLVKPGMTIKVKGLLTQYTNESIIKKTYASENLPSPLFAKEG